MGRVRTPTGWAGAPASNFPIFATPALRDSQWTNPPEGSMCVTTDTGSMWQRLGGTWYKPFSRLYRMSTSTPVNGIPYSGQSVIGTTPAIYIPVNNRLIEISVHLSVSTLNSGAYAHGWMDGNWIAGRVGNINAVSSYWTMNGVALVQPAVGSHTFSVGLYAGASGQTVNMTADVDMCWFEVWDHGPV